MLWQRIKTLFLLSPVLCATVVAQAEEGYNGMGEGDGMSGAWFWIILLIAAVTAAIWWMSRTAKPRGGGAGGPT